MIENLTTLTPNGQIGLLPPNGAGENLLIAFTHTHEEIRLRGNVDLTNFLKGAGVPKPRFPRRSPGTEAYSRRNDSRTGQFFKFGKRQHLEALLAEGRIRLNPASFYSDPSLNQAVRDDELNIHRVSTPGSVRITMPNGVVIGDKPGQVRDFKWQYTHTTDYYVWCVGSLFGDRLFDDFQADACLIIYDMNALIVALRESINAVLPSWLLCFDRVVYVDPYNWPREIDRPLIPFCKHHKYSYQHEWRFVVHPSTKVSELKPLDLVLRLPTGVAELIVI